VTRPNVTVLLKKLHNEGLIFTPGRYAREQGEPCIIPSLTKLEDYLADINEDLERLPGAENGFVPG
jgi:hypothetical protein